MATMKHLFVTWLLKCSNAIDQSTICIICRGTGWKWNGVWLLCSEDFKIIAQPLAQSTGICVKKQTNIETYSKKKHISHQVISLKLTLLTLTPSKTHLLLQSCCCKPSRTVVSSNSSNVWGHPWPGRKPRWENMFDRGRPWRITTSDDLWKHLHSFKRGW